MNARTASGTTLRWEVQRDMLKPDQLVMPVLATTGLPGPEKPLTKPQAMRVYKLLVDSAETFAQLDERDETREWLEGFGRASVTFEEDFADEHAKYRGTRHLQNYQAPQDSSGRTVPRWMVPPVLIDSSTGDRYIASFDLADHLRKDRRITVGVGRADRTRQGARLGAPRTPGVESRRARPHRPHRGEPREG